MQVACSNILHDAFRMTGMLFQQGSIAAFQFRLERANKQDIYRGLAMLNPVAVTVEESDLDKLIPSLVVRAGVKDAWPEVSDHFERISIDELMPRLEQAAQQTFNRPAPVSEQIQSFEQWCVANSLPIPGERQAARERFNEQQELEYAKRQRNVLNRRFEDNDWA